MAGPKYDFRPLLGQRFGGEFLYHGELLFGRLKLPDYHT